VLALLMLVGGGALSCGTGETANTGNSAGFGGVLTVDQALAAPDGQKISVQGMLVSSQGDTVLCSSLLESYPPQPGGASLELQGLDLNGLVGLSTTAGEPEVAQATWSDYPLTLDGVVDNKVLKVTKTPKMTVATVDKLRVRFAVDPDVPLAGGQVYWVFDIKNVDSKSIVLTFDSGQRGEVTLSQGGSEKYRWSADKSFTQSVDNVTIQPGKTWSFSLSDSVRTTPGRYDLVAKVTTSSVALAELHATVTIQ
jgi:hypothetical protein